MTRAVYVQENATSVRIRTVVEEPRVEITAMAIMNPGRTMIASVTRISTYSTLPRITPATTPTRVAKASASAFGTSAMIIATRAP